MDENEMKSLESRLRSWRPRRPSATLKWRLFLARAASVPRMIRIGGLADADHGLRAADPAGPEFRKRRPRRRPPAAVHHGDDEQPKLRGVHAPAASPSKTICPSLLLIGQTAAVRVLLATFRSSESDGLANTMKIQQPTNAKKTAPPPRARRRRRNRRPRRRPRP